MTWLPLDTWVVVVAIACAGACALPGTLLVLRRMSMMGDAISHTVLPGLAIAFLVTQSREPLPMFIGAIVVGIITAFLVEWVKNLGRTDGGTAMGVVFTALFALGLVIIRRAVDHVDLDPGCVLYGDVITTATDMMNVGGVEVPRALLINGGMFVTNLVAILLLYKEFKISAFDPALATTLGINSRFMHYVLMTMTAATTVAAFETVGSILVIAMLIVPAATAYLLTDRFGVMIILSVVIGAVAAVLGHISAITVPGWFGVGDTITSGMIAFCSGLIFVVVWMIAPRHGLLVKAAVNARMTLRVIREDVLGMLFRMEELSPAGNGTALANNPMREILQAGRVSHWLAMMRLRKDDKVRSTDTGFTLTDSGRSDARKLVRSHRLWETYLHNYLNLPADHVHPTAHILEHVTDEQMREDLAAKLAASTDPHGKEIPKE